jgi:hypothetical protein
LANPSWQSYSYEEVVVEDVLVVVVVRVIVAVVLVEVLVVMVRVTVVVVVLSVVDVVVHAIPSLRQHQLAFSSDHEVS